MDEAEKQIKEIMDKNKLQFSYEISFPIYKILPDQVKLALSVLKSHGMKITVVLKEKA